MGSFTGGAGTYANRGQHPARGRHAGRGPKGWHRPDDRIREEVSERLTDDPHVDASEIEVRVEAGEVTLSGTIDDRQAKRRAEDIAHAVSGVRDVHNRLRVQPAAGR
jgi:osmotically-inducible protein OsmY